MQLIKSMSI